MPDVLAPTTVTTTRALGAFAAAQPTGTRVLVALGARLKFNGRCVAPAGRPIWGQSIADGAGFGGHPVIERDESYGWRIAPDDRPTVNGQPNPAWNPRGRANRWQYDILGGYANEALPKPTAAGQTTGVSSLANPWGITANGVPISHGSEWGGYDATTVVDAAGHLHLVARYGAPWVGLVAGDVVQWLAASGTMGTGQGLIGSQAIVADDGRSIDLGPAVGLVHVDSSATLAWCIHRRGAGWKLVYGPDASVPPVYVGPTRVDGWDGYARALQKVANENADPALYVATGGQVVGFEIVGANPRRDLAISNYEKSDPVVNESQHNAYIEPGGQLILCESHHAWGDGINGPGEDVWNISHHNGRQGTPAHYNDKLIAGSTYYANHHSDIDIEGARVRNVKITATLGGTGVAISTPVDGLVLDLISTKEQVASGKIPALSGIVHSGHGWGGGGSDWNVRIRADGAAVHPSDPALTIVGGVVGLNVHDSRKPTTGTCFLKTDATNVETSNLDGGPTCTHDVCS